MGVILQSGLAADSPPGVPVIGYRNAVDSTNLTSTTAAAGFPVSNLANPATHLAWRGAAPTLAEGALLHFSGTDGSPLIVDSSQFAHTWTAIGNTQIDNAQFKFGATSAFFDGFGDCINGDGDGGMAFGLNDFTIDFWVRFAVVGTDQRLIDCRQQDGTVSLPVISLEKPATDKIKLYVTGNDRIISTTSMTANTWFHIALTRSGTNTRLFINGTQEGGTWTTDNTAYVVFPNAPRLGSGNNAIPNSTLNGWMDELRVLNGQALWTSNFGSPAGAADGLGNNEYLTIISGAAAINYIGIAKHNFGTTGALVSIEASDGNSPQQWWEGIPAQQVPDDNPIIFRFNANSIIAGAALLRVRIQPGTAAPQASVMYAGQLLVLERGVKVDVVHVPITFGRRTNIVNGMSETGNFLGRIVLSERRQSKAEFFGFTPTFYRANIDAFLDAAQEIPWFWAWAPVNYPLETGFAWLLSDAEPEVSPDHLHIGLVLEMGGIA